MRSQNQANGQWVLSFSSLVEDLICTNHNTLSVRFGQNFQRISQQAKRNDGPRSRLCSLKTDADFRWVTFSAFYSNRRIKKRNPHCSTVTIPSFLGLWQNPPQVFSLERNELSQNPTRLEPQDNQWCGSTLSEAITLGASVLDKVVLNLQSGALFPGGSLRKEGKKVVFSSPRFFTTFAWKKKTLDRRLRKWSLARGILLSFTGEVNEISPKLYRSTNNDKVITSLAKIKQKDKDVAIKTNSFWFTGV